MSFSRMAAGISLSLLLSSCGIFHQTKISEPTGKSEHTLSQKVIDLARKKIGSPYRAGGTTVTGYDCSGLVYSTFEEVGMKLPRTSVEQATVGREIAFEHVRPGDLVFFATKKNDRKISHVGLVTEIRDKEVVLFIHAANTGVKEDNLFSEYYRRTFVTARRTF